MKCNCPVVWTFLVTAPHKHLFLFFCIGADLFQPSGYWVFQICWHIEYRSLRFWNSSAGIPLLLCHAPPKGIQLCLALKTYINFFFLWKGSNKGRKREMEQNRRRKGWKEGGKKEERERKKYLKYRLLKIMSFKN